MSDASRIEWCDATWNPIVGCTPVSAGCEHCYAARMAKRLAGRCGYPKDWSKPTFRERALGEPFSWKKPRRVFVCSMGDLFHERVEPAHRKSVWNVMWHIQRHTFMVLTKRPERMAEWCAVRWCPPNVWLGVSVENQQAADERIPELLKVNAPVRFVSCEPLLGPVDIGSAIVLARRGDKPDGSERDLEWVIVGGETGPGARPMHPDWVRSIRDQCHAAGVPLFFKSWGEWAPWDDDNWSLPAGCDDVEASDRELWVSPDGSTSAWEQAHDNACRILRVGKRRSGRLLDGSEWSEFPEVTP